MKNPSTVITDHLDTWSSAIRAKSSAGRGSGKKQEFYGTMKLRELILELAVRGLLVPQDPTEEPSSELLKRCAKQESQLVISHKIRRKKPLPKIKESEMPFELPSSWSWIRLAEAGYDWGQKTPDSDFTYIDVGAIDKERGFISAPSVLSASEAPSRARKVVKNGTVIYSTIRPYLLNIAVVSESFNPEPIASTAFSIIHPFEGIDAFFVYHYLRSPSFVRYVESCQTGIAYPAINDKQFYSGLLPVPPDKEQRRIIAKVDELMALCDQLEQQQEDGVRMHGTLVQTLLGALTSASDRGQFAEAWQRIAYYFDILFTTESSIDQLKQTILELAVMGKLIEQDPEDEPASKLLTKIATENAKLLRSGKIKRQKPLSHISDDELQFQLPDLWEWCRFDQIIDQEYPIAYGVLVPGPEVNGGVPLVRVADLDIFSPSEKPEKSISNEVDAQYNRTRVIGGEIFMAVVGSIGKLGVAPMSWAGANIARALCRILPNKNIFKPYILILLQSDFMQKGFRSDTRVLAQPTLNIGLIRAAVTPIPPLAEQHRIVAKVDELVTLCDRLKAGHKTAQTTQLHLADCLVEAAIR